MAARRRVILAGASRASSTLVRVRLSPRTLIALAGGCAVAFLVLLLLAYAVGPAHEVDASALSGFVALNRDSSLHLGRFGHYGDPASVGILGIAIAALALARGRPRVALAVVVLIAVTSVSSQVLKVLLEHPRPSDLDGATGVDPASFPSGHSTAAMTLALAFVMAAPVRLRPLAGLLGVGFALTVGLAVMVDGGHFPSDVLGGYLLASGTTLLIAAAVRWADVRWPVRSRAGAAAAALRGRIGRVAALRPGALALACAFLAGLAGLAVLLTKLPAAVGYAECHTASVVVAGGLSASALALMGLVTATFAQRP
jgi:membrane-associated phospholipid phosphatase